MSFKKHNRQYDLVILGATGKSNHPHLQNQWLSRIAGYTGALTTEHIVKNFPADLKWAVAGRAADKLHKLVLECRDQMPIAAKPGMCSFL